MRGMMRYISVALVLMTTVDGWTTTTTRQARRFFGLRFVALNMGGYYNEPDDDPLSSLSPDVKTHMVFGIRCIEQTMSLSGGDASSVTVEKGVVEQMAKGVIAMLSVTPPNWWA